MSRAVRSLVCCSVAMLTVAACGPPLPNDPASAGQLPNDGGPPAAEAAVDLRTGGGAAEGPGFGREAATADELWHESLPSGPGCPSGVEWTQGDKGSAQMYPGRDCNACHADKGAPLYGAVGTVYETVDAWDDCYGVDGAVVVLTGADGGTVAMKSNAAGNFGTSKKKVTGLALPFLPSVRMNGRVRIAQQPHESLDCGSCHSEVGKSGAPGRIVAP